MQNLIAIALVVLITQKFEYFARWLKNAYSRPLLAVFGGKNRGKWKVSEFLSVYNPELTSCEANCIKSVLRFCLWM